MGFCSAMAVDHLTSLRVSRENWYLLCASRCTLHVPLGNALCWFLPQIVSGMYMWNSTGLHIQKHAQSMHCCTFIFLRCRDKSSSTRPVHHVLYGPLLLSSNWHSRLLSTAVSAVELRTDQPRKGQDCLSTGRSRNKRRGESCHVRACMIFAALSLCLATWPWAQTG